MRRESLRFLGAFDRVSAAVLAQVQTSGRKKRG